LVKSDIKSDSKSEANKKPVAKNQRLTSEWWGMSIMAKLLL